MANVYDTDDDVPLLDFSDILPPEDPSIPALKQCLEANQQLQKKLREHRQKIVDELIEVVGVEELNEEDVSNDSEDVKEGSSLNPLHINSLTPFLTPYFRDIRGLSAPDNSDVELKLSRQEIQQAYLLPCKSWSKSEEEELRQLVTADNVRRLTESLSNEKSKLYNDYKNLEQFPDESWTEKQLENGLKEIQDKIDDITNTMKSFLPEENVPSREESESLDWLRISAKMSTSRDDMACKVHWMNELHPSINKEEWTDEENVELSALVTELRYDWISIAERFSSPSKVRLPWQCMQQYQSKLNPEMSLTGPLTKSEAAFLDNVIEMCRIADYIPWHQVKYFVEGRTVAQLKHYWMKKTSLKRGDVWTKLEDEALVAAVLRHGKDDWKKVENYVYGRTNRQCRERYMLRLNVIDRRIGNWTKEEDSKLVDLAQKHDFRWAELERIWEGRNAKQLSHRYELLSNWMKESDIKSSECNQIKKIKFTRNMVTNCRDAKDIEEFLVKKLGELNNEKLDEYLKEVREKLFQLYENKSLNKGRKRKTTEEEDVEEQLAEIFSLDSLFETVENGALTRGILDQVVRDETKTQLDSILSGRQSKAHNPLAKVIKLVMDEHITQTSNCPNSSFAILPPNRALVRGIHNLILMQDFLGKNVPEDEETRSQEMQNLEEEKQTEAYKLLLKRFYSCFLWPSILSNNNAPVKTEPEEASEPRRKKSHRQIKKQRSEHAVNIAKCRDDQILLISSAQGDNKLDEMLKTLEVSSNPSQESVSCHIDRINSINEKVKKADAVKTFVKSLADGPKKSITPIKIVSKEVVQVEGRKSSRLAGKRVRVE